MESTDESGFARGEDGDIIHVSKEDIGKLLNRASMMERSCFCLLEHAEQFAKGDPVCKLYTEAEVKYMIKEELGDINWLQSANELVHQKKDSLQEEVHTLRQEMESQKKLSIDKGNTSSIDTISSSSTTYTQQ
ncbi:Uncharacterized protein Rs2_41072 [Raphanus sativus]|nr:Uncharacterized protein Rs2_41072 [Raphanus sativus]